MRVNKFKIKSSLPNIFMLLCVNFTYEETVLARSYKNAHHLFSSTPSTPLLRLNLSFLLLLLQFLTSLGITDLRFFLSAYGMAYEQDLIQGKEELNEDNVERIQYSKDSFMLGMSDVVLTCRRWSIVAELLCDQGPQLTTVILATKVVMDIRSLICCTRNRCHGCNRKREEQMNYG